MRILYIVYWGLLEPLGQALVLPPVLRFAAAGLEVALISFEKPAFLQDRESVRACAKHLREQGVRWIPLQYHQRPAAPATAFDIAQGCARSIPGQLGRRPDVVHGRTYVGGIIGRQVSRLLGRPFIFHNEGFWPDEQVEGGKWPEGCRPYRLTKRVELGMYRSAAGVITLSHPARGRVLEYRGHRDPETTVVVPSCVDLERFRPQDAGSPNGSVKLIYVGSLGGRYRLHEMARFLRAAREEIPGATLTVLSHSSPDLIRGELRKHGVADDWWSLGYVRHGEMPGALAAHHAGVFFLAPGVSSEVCSPTKIGEYWACGLPVVTTPRVGDVDRAVREQRVGVLVEADTDEACREAARSLRELLRERDLKQRCRAAAQEQYSLEGGVATQVELYTRLTRHRGQHA